MNGSEAPLETLFFRVGKTHRKIASRLLEQHCFHRGQTPLIFALSHEDGRSSSELAELLEVTPATISNMVKRMEKAGFVQRKGDPTDERVKRVWLTEQGQGKVQDLHDVMMHLQQISFGNFTAEEKEQFTHLMEKILANMEEGCCCCC
ncbi:MAG: MarR family winged helix-turn-helix transcriptional regulator [Anaerolineae bacterium]